MRIAVTGSSGFLGQALTAHLQRDGHEVVAARRTPGASLVWSVDDGFSPPSALSGFDAVVHLAGESIAAGRWTQARKTAILESRKLGTRRVVEALERADPRPSVLVSASAVGFYGNTADTGVDESSPPGDGFLAEVCQAWEAEAQNASALEVRVANPRFGLVLGDGGALAKMLTPFRLGAGGPLGSGQQYMPWVHIDDVARAIAFLLAGEHLEGPFNVTAPEPVTNATFTKALGRAVHRPAVVPAPAFALKLAFGAEMAQSLLLEGQRAVPKRLLDAGFSFEHPDLLEALRSLV